jgi:phospholipid-binding lipoprotein MlaA
MFDLRSFAFISGHKLFYSLRSALIIYGILASSGCATLDGPPNPDDPLERYNRGMFAFNETLDKAIVKPVAKGYNWIMPNFLNTGITNFFNNLDDVVVFANSLLQLKFAEALAFWGVDSGPYFVLPFLGPSTIRDGLSLPVDWVLFDPVFQDKELKVTLSLLAVRYTDKRADLISATDIIDATAPDKYAYIRDAFLQRRNYLIHDGNPPDTGLSDDELFNDDELFKDENLFEDDLDLEKDLKK